LVANRKIRQKIARSNSVALIGQGTLGYTWNTRITWQNTKRVT